MKNELTYKDINELFNKHFKWKNELVDSQTLNIETRDISIELIIRKLNSKDATIRYIASHMIIEFKIEQAKQKLIERIKDAETLNFNGTMAYALEHLNCQNNLKDIFEILATQSYESKMHAYNILSEQEFEFTRNDIIEMRQILRTVEKNKAKNQIFDDETFEMIKDGYEGFEQYLYNNENPVDNKP
jgi:HEAT repeat protein